MSIFKRDARKEASLPEVTKPKHLDPEDFAFGVDSTGFVAPELPFIREIKGKDWIYYGGDNVYPQHLKSIVIQSPTQGAIIKQKSAMMAGDEVMVNGAKSVAENEAELQKMDPGVRAAYDSFMANPNGKNTVKEIVSMLCTDYQMFGAMSLEVVWSMDFKRIAALKYVDDSEVRSGKIVNDRVQRYFISRDWARWSNRGGIFNYGTAYSGVMGESRPVEIAAFDAQDRENYNQLIYIKNGNLEYYGEPPYQHGLSYVELEGKIANFHLSNITNAFAPSMLIKFFTNPGSPEEKRDIVKKIKEQYQGNGNAGRAMIFFSDGKDLAPEVMPAQISDLHEQWKAVNDIMVQNILTANQVTSPLLFGISTPGSLGSNSELETAYQIFNSSVVEPDRKKIEDLLNRLLKINGIPVDVSLLPFNPLKDKNDADNDSSVANTLAGLQPQIALIVMQNMTQDEIRSLASLGPAQGPVVGPPKAAGAAGAQQQQDAAPVNENVKNLTGRQHQQLVRIIRQYTKGQITRDVASTLLRTGLGLNDDDVKMMLGENEDDSAPLTVG